MPFRKVQVALIVNTSGNAVILQSGISLQLSGLSIRDIGLSPSFTVDEIGRNRVDCRVQFNLSGDSKTFFDRVRSNWLSGTTAQKNRLLVGTKVSIHTCTHDLGYGDTASCVEDMVQVK